MLSRAMAHQTRWSPMIRYRRPQCARLLQFIASATRSLASAALIACVLAASSAARAQSFGVATWNLNWLMDADTHARWATACARNGWAVEGDDPAPTRRGALP